MSEKKTDVGLAASNGYHTVHTLNHFDIANINHKRFELNTSCRDRDFERRIFFATPLLQTQFPNVIMNTHFRAPNQHSLE